MNFVKKSVTVLICLICLNAAASAQYVSLNKVEITRLKKLVGSDQSAARQYEEIKRTALAALSQTPGPIDTIHTEGRLKGNPQKIATAKALADMHKIYALALVYRLDNHKEYLNKAKDFLIAWAVVNKPNGDPIDDTNLDGAVEGYDLIKDDLAPHDKAQVAAWLAATAQVEIDKLNPKRTTSFNNWHSHRLKVIGEIGFAIDDKRFQQFAIDGLKQQLVKNLNPDGSSIDFKLRDAMHYHLYDLEPLLKLAIILKRATGDNYYTYTSPTNTSIEKSVGWVLPYATGEVKHQEYVNSTVKFDRERANNHEAGFAIGAYFDPHAAVPMLTLASFFRPELLNTVLSIENSHEKYPDWQSVLNEVEK